MRIIIITYILLKTPIGIIGITTFDGGMET